MRTLFSVLLFSTLSILSTAACGVDVDTGDDGMDPDPPGPTDGYVSLINGDWSLPPASDPRHEKYVCVRLTAASDIYIKAIRPVAPQGTHHTVLMLGSPDGDDGVTDCNSALVKPAIYASGVGTQALTLPSGVAVHVRRGQQLLLNLHLFNGGDATLTGTSGIEILEARPEEVQHEAGVVLTGKAQGLQVPPNRSTQVGRCTTPANVTIFSIAPHMHMLGIHMRVSYANAGGGGVRELYNQDYSFDGQRFSDLATPLVTSAGGRLTIECTYMNTTGQTVVFGESSTQEMCYALTFVYPAQAIEQCVQ
jgi:hypothetical protein